MALDAQSVKWGNRQSDNGFDANKKVKIYLNSNTLLNKR